MEKKDNGGTITQHLLDTLGNSYRVAYDLKDLNPDITALDLQRQNLRTLPDRVCQQTQLNVLLLNGNELTTLPESISKLTNLQTLDLNWNELTTLPESISKLTNLQRLNLSGNKLTTLPENISQLTKLQELNLRDNKLTTLPESISKLSNLQGLDLSGTQLTTLPESISRLTNLRELDLGDNQLTTLPESIGQLTNLQTLRLSFNQLTTLPESIGQLTNLQKLDLRNNPALAPYDKELNGKELKTFLEKLAKGIIRFYPNPEELFKEKKYAEALVSYLKVIEDDSTNYYAIGNAGLCYRLLGKYKEAETYLTNYLEKVPNDKRGLEQLQILYFMESDSLLKLEKYDEALSFNLKTMKQDSTNYRAIGYAGLCYCLLGKYKEAETYLSNFLEKIPNDKWGLEQLGLLFQETKQYPKAYSVTQKLCSIDSTNYNNWYSLSWYALFVNKPQEAISAAQKILALDSTKVGVETNLALGYLLNNQYPEAEKIYLKWKGKSFPNNKRLCNDIFLADIATLETAGITHPDFAKVRLLLKTK